MKPHNSRYYYCPTATLYLPSVAKYWAVKWIIEAYQYLNNNTREDVDNNNVILKNETSNLILVILLHNRGCSTHPLAIGTTIICSKWCIALLPALFCVNLATEKVRLLINNSCWRPVLKVEFFLTLTVKIWTPTLKLWIPTLPVKLPFLCENWAKIASTEKG